MIIKAFHIDHRQNLHSPALQDGSTSDIPRNRSSRSTGIFSFLPVVILICMWTMGEFAPGKSWGANLSESRLFAVIVGLKQFKDPKIPSLTISDKDAKDFHTFLKEREKTFKKSSITLLLNEQATRANVAKALRENLKPAGKDDVVIIFLSGHGAADANYPDEFYFITYDTQWDNLAGSALMMSDKHLFRGIDSNRVLMLADACHSGGFPMGIQQTTAKEAGKFFNLFDSLHGRIAISSSKPDEKSFEDPKFGNSIFTHYVLKGMRGDTTGAKATGLITTKDLYTYVYERTREATNYKQNPQLFSSKGKDEDTPIFSVRTYSEPLKIKTQFYYEDDSKQVQPLVDGAVLKSGDKVGVAFKSEADCFVYIFWWDSGGQVGRLFPNPELTSGAGDVKAGKTYWLPADETGERWYVLDDQKGEETIYFVASRQRNQKLEQLFDKLQSMSGVARNSKEVVETGAEIEREINLMGYARHSVAKTAPTAQPTSFPNRQDLFENMDNQIQIAGGEAITRIKYIHQ